MFLSNVFIAAKQIIILYSMVGVGFACDKTKLFTEKTARQTNNLLFYVTTPAIIIQSFLGMEFNKQVALKLVLAFVGGMAIHLIAIIISLPFFRKCPKDKGVVYRFACIYGNVGYMALPLAKAILGTEGVFYCSVGVIAFNIFCFTHGVLLMSDREKGKLGFNPKNLIINPGVISVIIGLPLFVLSINLPDVIQVPLDSIAAVNTPLAMIVFGTYLANSDFRTVFKEKEIYLTALLKLIVLPIIVLVLYKVFGATGSFLVATMITASAPSANNTAIFSAKYNRDVDTASKTVSVVSFLSIITMPIIIALAKVV